MKKAISSFKHYIRSLNYSKIIDTLIIFCGLTLVISGSYLVFTFNSNNSDVGNLEPIAKVERIYLSPKRKIDGALSWGSIAKGHTLYRGDQVVTDDFSKVDIKFDDNSSLNIPSNSLVKIDYRKDGIHLELIKGLVSLDLKGAKSKVFLKKGEKSYQLDGENGNVEIRKNGSDLEFSSDKGNVKVLEIANGKSKSLNVKKKIVKFIFPEGRQKLDPIKSKNVLIAVKGLEKQKDYLVTITNRKTKGINKLKLKGSVLNDGHRFPFTRVGIHQVSLSDAGNKNGFIKETNFSVRDYPSVVFMPESLQEKRTVMAGDLVTYEWRKIANESYVVEIKNKDNQYRKAVSKAMVTINPKESSLVEFRARLNHPDAPWTSWRKQYVDLDVALNRNDSLTKETIFLDSDNRFLALNEIPKERVIYELARDKDFKMISFSMPSIESKILIPSKFQPGQYYWRVREDKKTYKKSKTYPVKLTAYAVNFSEKMKTTFVTSKKQNHKIKLRWQERLSKASYKVGIRKKGQEKPFKVIAANKTSVQVTLPDLGQYEFLVVPRNFKEVLKPNKPLTVNVMLPELNVSLKPQDVVLKRSSKLGLTKHYMKLPRLDKKKYKKMLVTIYKDKEGKQRVFSTATTKPYIIWKTKRSGLYHYKLRVEDKWGRISNYTKPKNVLFPISPFFVTSIRVPAGRKRYYKFPYVTKRGDDLATILRNFTKPSAILSNRSPMVQKIMDNNKHIKNWNKIRAGKKITVFVNADVLDKTFLYVYKRLFVVKD